MKIAILAWGSLIWEGEERGLAFTIEKGWTLDGPNLLIEFSRVSCSRQRALTLVIDPENGAENPTWFAESSRPNLIEAIHNLAYVEGITNLERITRLEDIRTGIGFVDCIGDQSHIYIPSTASSKVSRILCDCLSKIRDWAKKNDFDAVIWTDLRSNFRDRMHMEFTVDNAQKHLHILEEGIDNGAEQARKYIKKAPQEVETPVRERMRDDPWLDK